MWCVLLTKYYPGDKSRRMRWAGYVARMGEWKGANRDLVVRNEGKRQLDRPRHR